MKINIVLALAIGFISIVSRANEFKSGPIIDAFGKHVAVEQTQPIDKHAKFKILFDVSDAADVGTVNRKFESLARFINMHVANGVPFDHIKLALVVHGKAGNDLLKNDSYLAKYNVNNANVSLVNILLKQNAKIIICGQSAAYYQIDNEQLIPGVEVALSAMTANALLQQQGYTLNPF